MSWLFAACDHDTSDAGPRAAAAVASIALQRDEFKPVRDAQLLPMELDYRLQVTAPGRPAMLELTLHTALTVGVLEVKATSGAIAGGAVQRRIDLGSAPRPLLIALELLPASQPPIPNAAPLTATIEVATRQAKGRQARVFRIVLPEPTAVPANPS